MLEALIEFIYCGEILLDKDKIDSFVKLITDVELFVVTEEVIEKERSKNRWFVSFGMLVIARM